MFESSWWICRWKILVDGVEEAYAYGLVVELRAENWGVKYESSAHSAELHVAADNEWEESATACAVFVVLPSSISY